MLSFSTTAHCTRLELFGHHVRAYFDTDLVPRPGSVAVTDYGAAVGTGSGTVESGAAAVGTCGKLNR